MAFTSAAPHTLRRRPASSRCGRHAAWRVAARACATAPSGITRHESADEWDDAVFILSGPESQALLDLPINSTPQSATVDLGLRTISATPMRDAVIIDNVEIPRTLLSRASRGGAWAVLPDGHLSRISTHGSHAALSLHPVPGTSPTLVLGGFGMHRLDDPYQDTANKIIAAQPRGAVLDICTGLGYTASAAAARAEVRRVVTIERDAAVMRIARVNPWSRALFNEKKIARIIGDATDIIDRLPKDAFDTVIHDPPAMAVAGELYGGKMYASLHRVCKRDATLFHYIGNPSSKESGRLYKGITNRLSFAGFKDITVARDAYGVVARA